MALAFATGTTIFAIIDRTLLSPPPYPEPDRLVVAGEVPMTNPGTDPRPVRVAMFEAWRGAAPTVMQLEAYDPTNVTLSGMGAPERVSATASTPGLFHLLGVSPRMGRVFSDAEAGVVVVSHEFWQRYLQADPNPLGTQIVLGGEPHEVIGVLPPSFAFALDQSTIWLPLDVRALGANGRVRVVGRLRPGITRATAVSQLASAAAPASEGQPQVVPLARLLSRTARTALPLLLTAALLAVALTAVNLAGLLLLRTLDRSRELSIRAALGATRLQIATQVLVESHVLVALGAAMGALLMLWMMPAAALIASEQLGATFNASASPTAFMALAVVALLCAWTSGLTAALSASRRSAALSLGHAIVRFSPLDAAARRALVAGEVTLAFVLLVSMLLVGRSLQQLTSIHAGFNADAVLSARVSLPPVPYASVEQVRSFYARLDEALATRVAAGSASFVDELPLTGGRGRTSIGRVAQATSVDAVLRVVGPRYFSVMEVPLLQGREFTPRDDAHAVPKVVLSHTAAQKVFPGERVVGQRLVVGGLDAGAEVIGVVGDVKHRALDDPDLPTIYLSGLQEPSRSSHVVTRTADAAEALQRLREEVRRLDGGLPVYAPQMLDDIVARSPGVPVRKVVSAIFGAFALLALTIAAVGLFGVVANDVSRRRVELALRLALGADPQRLRRSVFAQALRILLPGIGGGVLLSFAFSRSLRVLIPQAPLADPVIIAGAAAILISSALAVAAIPARRAARTSAFTALRGE